MRKRKKQANDRKYRQKIDGVDECMNRSRNEDPIQSR